MAENSRCEDNMTASSALGCEMGNTVQSISTVPSLAFVFLFLDIGVRKYICICMSI